MERFSTFQVSQIFDIDPTSLQEWIDEGVVTPHRQSAGEKTTILFSREDLYRLRLFMLLLPWLSQSRAKSLSDVNFENVGAGKNRYKYCCLVVPLKQNFVEGSVRLLREISDLTLEPSDFLLQIINLQAVKNEVDGLLGG